MVQDYSQRIEGANISGLKLSRSPGFENFNYNNALLNYNNGLKAWKFQILKFQQWSQAGVGERGGGGGQGEIIYSSPSIRKKSSFLILPMRTIDSY